MRWRIASHVMRARFFAICATDRKHRSHVAICSFSEIFQLFNRCTHTRQASSSSSSSSPPCIFCVRAPPSSPVCVRAEHATEAGTLYAQCDCCAAYVATHARHTRDQRVVGQVRLRLRLRFVLVIPYTSVRDPSTRASGGCTHAHAHAPAPGHTPVQDTRTARSARHVQR